MKWRWPHLVVALGVGASLLIIGKTTNQKHSVRGARSPAGEPVVYEKLEGKPPISSADFALASETRQKAIQLEADRRALEQKLQSACTLGNQEDCFVHYELTSGIIIPNLSDNPRKSREDIREQFERIKKLCLKGYPLACVRVGSHFDIYGSGKTLPEFQEENALALARKINEISASAYHYPTAKLTSTARFLEKLKIPKAAIQTIDRQCLKGSAVDCFWLGVGWLKVDPIGESLNTRSVKKVELAKATRVEFYCKSLPSQCALAVYFKHAGGSIDDATYRTQMQRLCNEGSAKACRELGVTLEEKDPKASLQLETRACELGYGEACGLVASRMKRQGQADKALQYAVRGCTGRFECNDLVIEHGSPDSGVPIEARRWIADLACRNQSELGCRLKYKLLFQMKKPKEARIGFGIQCDEGDVEACRYAAQVEFKTGNKDAAVELLSHGCYQDDINSCYELANLHVARGYPKAAKSLYDEWCEKGSPSVCESRKKFLDGFVPRTLSEIFQKPIDDSEAH